MFQPPSIHAIDRVRQHDELLRYILLFFKKKKVNKDGLMTWVVPKQTSCTESIITDGWSFVSMEVPCPVPAVRASYVM